MNGERETYFYNPYLPELREDKGERMSIIRATLLVCITVLISVTAVLYYNHHQGRFQIVAQKDGIFVFDHKSTVINYCTTKGCKMVAAELMMPKVVQVATPILPMPQPSAAPQPMQHGQLVAPNYSMMPPNQQQAQPQQMMQMPMQTMPGVPTEFSTQMPQGGQQKPKAAKPAATASAEGEEAGEGGEEEEATGGEEEAASGEEEAASGEEEEME
jgi:hypothetical protein